MTIEEMSAGINSARAGTVTSGNISVAGGSLNQYIPPTSVHPCPCCGYCPTCGRGYHHPYPYPTWTWPNTITCGSTVGQNQL